MSPTLFALIVAASALLGVAALALFALLWMQARSSEHLQDRLRREAGVLAGIGTTAGHPFLTALARRGQGIERWLDKEGETARLLLQAGWRDAAVRLSFEALQALLPLLALLATLAMGLSGSARPMLVPLYGFMLIVAALLAPRWLLRRAAARRRRRIKNEVPLFIHLLVLLFEAGLSTRQAIASLVREGRGVLPELGREFEVLLRSLEAGGDTAELLKGLGDALEVPELSSVLSVLRQVDRYGGEIREPLMDAMHVLEERRDLDLREAINRMSAKMTFVMVLFFLPALLTFVAGPAVMAIITAIGEATGP